MVKMVSLWNLRPGVTPEDFEKQYFEVHVPLARRLPGLKRYQVSKVRPSKNRETPFYRMAQLYWEDMEALRRMMSSPQASKVANDQGFHSKIKDFVQIICDEKEIDL